MKRFNMINKIFICSLILIQTVLLISCTKGRSGKVLENDKEIHIRVWETKNGIDNFIKQAGKIYSEKNPNIKIDYIHVPLNDIIPMLEKDGPANLGADIIASPHDNLGTLVSKKISFAYRKSAGCF